VVILTIPDAVIVIERLAFPPVLLLNNIPALITDSEGLKPSGNVNIVPLLTSGCVDRIAPNIRTIPKSSLEYAKVLSV